MGMSQGYFDPALKQRISLLTQHAKIAIVLTKMLRTELMMITTLARFLVSCTVFGPVLGQTPNVSPLRVETAEIVAEVNGDKITRTSLAAECLQLHGEEELHELINKTLIRQECERQKIVITADEINAEVRRMAQTFSLTAEQWLQVLEQKRGISPDEYRQDIIWRILALGKLADSRLNPSEAELQMAYEAQFGPAVQARQIVLAARAEAEAVLAELKQHPETFAAVAKNKSICTVTQPYGGMLYPIRRHTMDPNVERILFALKPGEISPIIEMPPGQFTVYKCEGYLAPAEVDVEGVKKQLFFQLRDGKLQQIAGEVFKEMQSRAQVKIIFGEPALYSQYPGIAAFLNGREISIKELAELCLQKYGKEVSNDMIYRLLIEQACRKENLRITEPDIDKEIREMALKYLPLLPDGTPNVGLWLQRATEESGLSIPMYRKNVIVPVLSLKRLTFPLVQVTEEDIQRAFEAHYGSKVRCLAIFFPEKDSRRAQEVWQKANRHRTEDNFGNLAAEYSFDPDSRLGRGVIPPIARHCGQPELEKEAFALKPGELSQIIQIDEHLVILYCVGYTDPVSVKIENVRMDLIADLFEKKQQAIVARHFEKLYEQAVVNNYLTGESRKPD